MNNMIKNSRDDKKSLTSGNSNENIDYYSADDATLVREKNTQIEQLDQVKLEGPNSDGQLLNR